MQIRSHSARYQKDHSNKKANKSRKRLRDDYVSQLQESIREIAKAYKIQLKDMTQSSNIKTNQDHGGLKLQAVEDLTITVNVKRNIRLAVPGTQA